MKPQIIACVMLLILTVHRIAAQQDTSAVTLPDTSFIYPADEPVQTENYSEPSEEPRLQVFGYIQSDDRLKFLEGKLNYQEYRLDAQLEYKPGEKSKMYAEVWLRSYHFPEIQNISDLSDKKKVLNFDADLREAYVDIYGLFTKNFDVRIGRQRIAWGTADRLNPTDNLNPYDMEDIWDFGRHLGSNAIKLTYYLESFTFTGVAIPWFTPSVLPGPEWTPAFMPAYEIPQMIIDTTFVPGLAIPIYLTPGVISDTLALPQKTIKHYPSFGLKVKKSFGSFDLSVSYVYGRDALPLPAEMKSNITIDTFMFAPQVRADATIDIKTTVSFPVMKVLGFDFAGSIKGVGIWGEAACFFPQKNYMKRTLHYSVPGLGISKDSVMSDSLVLDNKPYIKFVAGLDYTFKHGFYLNFQYLHGFTHERGPHELNDYYMLSFQWTSDNGRLKIGILNGGIQVNDYKYFSKNIAWIYMPEISYKPVDNAELILGAHLLDGNRTTSFGKVTRNDDIFLKLKYSF
ncbi:MAG TPA: hypothetical protein PKW80_10705 [Bacteroidales bacterium]|nr:hypothetical protein [Bacteroidales bacterium]